MSATASLPTAAAAAAAAAPLAAPSPPAPSQQQTSSSGSSGGSALARAARAACAGGVPGAAAAATQTCAFMWLSTAVSFQHGTGVRTARAALSRLYAEGGVRRMYSGLGATLVYGALSRLGDVGANAGVMHALEDVEAPLAAKTAAASAVAAGLRVALVPLEAAKQNLQVRGVEAGLRVLTSRVERLGLRGLWHGSFASAAGAFSMHFPFFLTVNGMSSRMAPRGDDVGLFEKIVRNGGMGFCAQIVADTGSNAFKVVATTQQTSKRILCERSVVERIVEREGTAGLVMRGLKTRMFSNALQGAFFVIVWKELEGRWADR